MTDKKILLKNIFFTILYAIFTLILVLHHEIWADEAQVWMLAKYLSVPELFKHLVNEGHPSLFYLLMMPFAKTGMSIFCMQFVCWISTVISVFLLLQFSPFSKFTKFAIITSAGFLYFFPVIARSYSILPLLIFTAAILYLKQNKKPILYGIILALIASTHVITFAFVFVLGLLFIHKNFIKEKNYNKNTIICTSIILAGLLGVIVQLFGTFHANGAINFSVNNFQSNFLKTISVFFLNTIDLIFKSDYNNVYINLYNIIAASIEFILLGILIIQLFFTNKKAALICIASLGFQFFIYTFSFKAMIYQTRIFTAYLILIFCYWITLSKEQCLNKNKFTSKKLINALLGIFFIITLFCGIKAALLDLFNNYSSAKQTANFIQKNISPNSLILPNVDACPLAVYMYLPNYKFYSVYREKPIKYMIWYQQGIMDDKNFSKLVEKAIKKQNAQNTYIIVSSLMNAHHLDRTLPYKYTLIYKSSPAIASGEAFRIYKYIGENK